MNQLNPFNGSKNFAFCFLQIGHVSDFLENATKDQTLQKKNISLKSDR